MRRLALAASRGQVFLYYQDEESGQFYAGPVDVISVSRLESAVSGLSDNGACFAFEKEGYSLLSPYTLLMPGTPQPAVYQVYNPLSREEGPQQPAGGTGLPGQQQLHLSGDRRRVGGAQRV